MRIHLLLHQAHDTVVNFVPYLRPTCTLRCQVQRIAGTFTAPKSCKFQQIGVQRRNKMLCRLSLGELGSATGGLQAVLLSFLHSGVTGQETSGLQSCTVLSVDAEECAGNAMTDGAGLTGNAAALDGADDVDLADVLGGDQGLTNDQLQGVQTKVVVDVAAVDDDGAGAVLVNANTGDGRLTSAGAVLILSLALVHCKLPPN